MAEEKSLGTQIKEHPVIATAAVLAALASGINITTVTQAIRTWDSLADKQYVIEQIEIHTEIVDKRFDAIELNNRRIRAFVEVVPELKNLIRLRCMEVQGLDATIARLEREYLVLTGEVYEEPPCDRLLVP